MSAPRTALLRIEAIVTGASAGGVEALGILFEALPAQFVPAILTVLHLPPARPSGLAAVRSAGGSAWVQQPGDARSETMPAAAIMRAGADFVLPVGDMAQRLVH